MLQEIRRVLEERNLKIINEDELKSLRTPSCRIYVITVFGRIDNSIRKALEKLKKELEEQGIRLKVDVGAPRPTTYSLPSTSLREALKLFLKDLFNLGLEPIECRYASCETDIYVTVCS